MIFHSLLSLQGPFSAKIIKKFISSASNLNFMQIKDFLRPINESLRELNIIYKKKKNNNFKSKKDFQIDPVTKLDILSENIIRKKIHIKSNNLYISINNIYRFILHQVPTYFNGSRIGIVDI